MLTHDRQMNKVIIKPKNTCLAAARFELAPPKRLVSYYSYRSVTLYFVETLKTRNHSAQEIDIEHQYILGEHNLHRVRSVEENNYRNKSKIITKLIRKRRSMSVLRA